MKRPNPGHALRFTQGNPAKELFPKPVLPTKEQTAILRRAAAGYIFVTNGERGTQYRYNDGTTVTLRRSKIGPGKYDEGERDFGRMVKEGWLVPDKGDTLFEDSPAQIYRTRK